MTPRNFLYVKYYSYQMSLFFGLSLQMQTRALRVRCSKIKLFEADLWTCQVVGKKVDITQKSLLCTVSSMEMVCRLQCRLKDRFTKDWILHIENQIRSITFATFRKKFHWLYEHYLLRKVCFLYLRVEVHILGPPSIDQDELRLLLRKVASVIKVPNSW